MILFLAGLVLGFIAGSLMAFVGVFWLLYRIL